MYDITLFIDLEINLNVCMNEPVVVKLIVYNISKLSIHICVNCMFCLNINTCNNLKYKHQRFV